MFETAELGRAISKKDYRAVAGPLREELLRLQDRLKEGRDFQVLVVFSGVDGAGKTESVAMLNEWIDARWLHTLAYDVPTDVELQHPEYWRYWRDLPPRGRIGLYLSAWYSRPVLDRVYGRSSDGTFFKQLERIASFERALANDGALILKFWMHLSHSAQEERLKSMEMDPLTRARVGERDWENWHSYDRFIATAEQVIARTNTGNAQWQIVEGIDSNYRTLKVATALRNALKRRLEEADVAIAQAEARRAPLDEVLIKDKKDKNGRKEKNGKASKRGQKPDLLPEANAKTVLSCLDMDQSIEKKDYSERLVALQAETHLLHLRAKEQGVASVLLFEGPDAAGKGGAIRRLTSAMSPKNYQVHGVVAPTEDEKAQHYLWRFWRHIPQDGYCAIFDRSWYGRVLVERVEGFASSAEWRRAYAEINDFENQLIEHGIVLLKIWLHITKDEQYERFKLREETAYKKWKLTEEDWRNRERWHEYGDAVNDMVQYTSTHDAPWHLVPSNDKRFARIRVLEIFRDALASALDESADVVSLHEAHFGDREPVESE